MGSNMKKSIFDEQTSKALKKWHNAVKKRHARGERSPTRTLGDASPSVSSMGSPLHPTGPVLHRYKTTGHSTRPFQYDEHTISDLENDDPSPHEPLNPSFMVRVDHGTETELILPSPEEEEKDESDFSFAKPARHV